MLEAVFMFLVIFYALYFGVRRGVPAAARAMRAHRRKKINEWNKAHPNAPTPARWWASAGATAAALRWGPRFFWTEFTKAFKDAFDDRRKKYDIYPKKEKKPDPKTVDPADPPRCIKCDGPLPENKSAAGGFDPCPRCDVPKPDDKTDDAPAPTGDQKPESADPGGDPSQPDRSKKPMSEKIEITGPQSLLDAMKHRLAEATAEFEAATATRDRALARVKRNDEIVAALKGYDFPADDLSKFVNLMEPDQQAVAAAEAEMKACEARMVAAQECVTVAEKHVRIKQEQNPAGRFYQGE